MVKTPQKQEQVESVINKTPTPKKNEKLFNKVSKKLPTVYIMSDEELLDTVRYFLKTKNSVIEETK